MDMLFNFIRRHPSAPPIVQDKFIDKAGIPIELPKTAFPSPTFTKRLVDEDGKSLPQVIAHRGHKAGFPENSLRAFRAAIEAGTNGIETDVHLSRDKVVVLAHDHDLKRCYGVEKCISDYDWDYLKTLRTTRAPAQPMARLEDLLQLLAEDSSQGVWMLLDIKIDDDPEELMMHIAKTFASVAPGKSKQWKDRVVLGYWAATYIPLCHKYLPGFPIANIGFSVPYSGQFLRFPGSAFNLMQAAAVAPSCNKFIQEAQAQGRPVYTWTVNDEKSMDLCIRRGVDGVITDDVVRFQEVCRAFRAEKQPSWQMSVAINFLRINFWIFIFNSIFRRRYGMGVFAKESMKDK